jgi:N-acetylmuramoyl-L-alanine amidase
MVSISPQYLPPEKENKKHKQRLILLVVFLSIIALLVVVIYQLFFKHDPTQEAIYRSYSICDFTPQEQQEKIQSRDVLQTVTFQDYLFYGESFSVFKNKYQQGTQDEFVGKTIQFRDLCTDTIHSFLMNENLDTNVPLADLPVGFYEVIIQENLNAFRLVYPTNIDEHFTTITRDSKRHDVHFIANNRLFTDIYTQGPLLRDYELFLEVKETTKNPEIVDVVLDPAYNSQDFGPVDKGLEVDGFIGSDETYKFATDVKQKLEAKGLVVKLTRPDKDLVVNTYGDTGRVFAAMDSKAKLMVELYYESVEDRNLSGTSAYGSQSVSLNFQEQLIRQFDAFDLPIFEGIGNQHGVFYNQLMEGLDSSNLIRESGGYALSAGEFSNLSQRLNGFAIGNRYGVHTVSLNVLMGSNWDFLETYRQNYDQMVEATANGILAFIGVEP